MAAPEERLARLPCWRGPVTFEPLAGGLTNLSFVATHGGIPNKTFQDMAAGYRQRERLTRSKRCEPKRQLFTKIINANRG